MNLETNRRSLIIHADDGGLCRSVNKAIIDSLNKGIVTSTSLMAPTPYFEEIAVQLTKMPQADVGVHLTLNCMYEQSPWKPVSSPDKVSSLVNADGSLLETVTDFAVNATPEDVRTEIRSQIERLFEMGLKPSHIDSHQGTIFLNTKFLQSYIELAQEYDLIPMLLKPNEFTKKMIESRNLPLNSEDLERLTKIDLPFLDFLFMEDIHQNESFDVRKLTYYRVIQQLPVGLSQIIIHPGYDDEELRNLTDFSYNREYDFSIFTDDETRKLIEKQNIKLTSWDALKDTSNS
ncbi:ChbG/HpnK family deacetylase [candidate division KSB1 bacterium]|nr:ChbG/HpnK family deacetylase [candidate division KSB1 bacterium]